MFDWIHGNSRLPNSLTIVELLVDMDCQGCEKKVRKAISKLDGVNSVEIDMDRQKVTITGYVDREEVLKMVKRTGRTTEFWPYPYNGYYGDYDQYFEQQNHNINHVYNFHDIQNSDNYSFNWSTNYIIGLSQKVSSSIDDNALQLFSDDNVHACIVM